MLNRLFGRNKQTKPASADQGDVAASLGKLDMALDLLEKRESVMEKRMEHEREQAKKFYTKGNKNSALQCMKRVKLFEDQLSNLTSQRQNLETLKFTIQNQNMNQEVLKAQVHAKNELKKANHMMKADKIDENMDELRDEMDKANQVDEALRQPLDNNFVDEDELMQELELEMGAHTLGAKEKKDEQPAKIPEMPTVPTSKLPLQEQRKKTQEEEDEDILKALEAALI